MRSVLIIVLVSLSSCVGADPRDRSVDFDDPPREEFVADYDFLDGTVLDELLAASEPLGDEFFIGIEEYQRWTFENPGQPFSSFVEWASDGSFGERVSDMNVISGGVSHLLFACKLTLPEASALERLLSRNTDPRVAEFFSDPEAWVTANRRALSLLRTTAGQPRPN